MNGPGMLDALISLYDSEAPRDALLIEGNWQLDGSGRRHSPAHEGLDSVDLTDVHGTLGTFLQAKRCNRRTCNSIVSLFGLGGDISGAIAQGIYEAEKNVKNTLSRRERLIHGSTSARNVEPIRRVVDRFPSAGHLAEIYIDYYTDILEAGRAEFFASQRTEEALAVTKSAFLEEYVNRTYQPFEKINLLVSASLDQYDEKPGHSRVAYYQRANRVENLADLDRVLELLPKLQPQNLVQMALAESSLEREETIVVGPNNRLVEKVADIWRSAVRREARKLPGRISELRAKHEIDERVYLIYDRNGVGNHASVVSPNMLAAAYAVSPMSFLLVVPGVVRDVLLPQNANQKNVVEVQSGEMGIAAIEICETLLNEAEGTEPVLSEVWETAIRLARG